MLKQTLSLSLLFTFSSLSIAQNYVLPPSSSTRGHVPVVSDELMEQCVEVYNQAKWLEEKINQMVVDQYSNESVSQYNVNVDKHHTLTNWFNNNCAGKQSYSACKATQELNRKAGNPVSDCR